MSGFSGSRFGNSGGGSASFGSITGDPTDNAALTAALDALLSLSGGQMSGPLSFSGTTHAGLRLNNLTTTQRNAIASPAAGMTIWNTTQSRMNVHNGSSWTDGFVRLAGDTMTGALGVTLTGLGTTPTAGFTLANSTSATSGNQQVSPSFVLEGQGWKTDATAASQVVRFRLNVLPVQGTANPSASFRIQSDINNAGTWADRLTLDSAGTLRATEVLLLAENSGLFLRAAGSLGIRSNGTQMIDIRNNQINFGANAIWWASAINAGVDVGLVRDAAQTLAQRNGLNAQTFRVYGTFTDTSNYRRVNLSMSTAGVAVLTAEGAGTGASGNVIHISSLPTANPGPGILWNNAGTPAIGT